MRFSKIVSILIFMLMLIMTVQSGLAETFVGDTVYISDENVLISATPHTLTSSGTVELIVKSKQYTGNVNVIFGFNSSQAIPKGLDKVTYTVDEVYDVNNDTWTNATTKNVNSIANQFNQVAYDYDGKNIWYYATNLPVVAGTEYILELEMDVLGGSGKYDVAIYPSSYGTNLGQAITNGHFYMLDPYWSVTEGVSGLESSLYMFWELDDNDATETDNHNHGKYDLTVDGATYNSNSEVVDGWYYFDGTDDYTRVNGDSEIWINESFTLSAWFTINGTTGDIRQIMGSCDDQNSACTGGDYYGLGIYLDTDNKLYCTYLTGEDTYATGTYGNTSILENYTLYHVVCTYDLGTREQIVYINGHEVPYTITKQDAVLNLDFETPFCVGAECLYNAGAHSERRYWKGYIDEAGIWNKKLTATEVLRLYQKGIEGRSHPWNYYNDGINHHLITHLSFDNNSLSDYSVNKNEASNNGATYVGDGIINGGYYFDGTNDYINISDSLNEMLTYTDGTIGFWARINSTETDCALYGAGTEGDGIGRRWRFLQFLDASTSIQVTGADNGGSYTIVGTNNDYDYRDDLWHHYVYKAGSNIGNQLYIDGNLINLTYTTGNSATNGWFESGTDLLVAGARVGTPAITKFCDIDIDEFTVWGRNLTSTEIEWLNASGAPNVSQQYPFNNSNNLIARIQSSYEPVNEEANYTIEGNPVGVSGMIDGAIDFDGTGDMITIANMPTELNYANNFTITGWFNMESCDDAPNTNLWGMFDGATDRLTAICTGTSPNGYIRVHAGHNGGDIIQLDMTAGTGSALENEWHMFTMKYVTSTLGSGTVYGCIDNSTCESQADTVADFYDAGAEFNIGGQGGTANYLGISDDIRIINHSITDAERSALFNAGAGNKSYTFTDEILRFRLDTLADQHGSNHLAVGAGTPETIANNGWDLDGTSDYLISSSAVTDITDTFSLSFEIYPDVLTDNTYYTLLAYGLQAEAPNNFGIQKHGDTGDDELRIFYDGASDYFDCSIFNSTYAGKWSHVVIVMQSGVPTYTYINGTATACSRTIGADSFSMTGNKNLYIGQNGGSAQYFNGKFRNLRIYNRDLSDADVLYLYNGTNNTYDFNTWIDTSTPVTVYMDIILTNLNIFNATVRFNSTVTNYTTTDGSINTSIVENTGLANVTIWAKNYFNITETGWNTTNDINTSIARYPIITIIDVWDNSTEPYFNVTYNTITYNTGTTYLYIPVNDSNASLHVYVPLYIERNVSEINLSPDTNVSIDAWMTNVTINAKEISTENLIYNWTLHTAVGDFSTNTGFITIFPNIGNYYWNWSNNESYFNHSELFFSILTQYKNMSISNLYARDLYFENNLSVGQSIIPTCNQSGYSYSSYPYHLPKDNSVLQCSLTQFQDINFTLNTSMPENATYKMQPAILNLIFDQNTSGFVQTIECSEDINNCDWFNASYVYIEQYNISIGYVDVIFNPTGDKWEQLFSYYNDDDTHISEYITIYTPDLVQELKITGDGAPLENARVCAKKIATNPDTNNTEWITGYCDFTDISGLVKLSITDQSEWKFCVQKDGYVSQCEMYYIPPNNADTIIIDVDASESDLGFNYVMSSCPAYFNTAMNCTLNIATYKPYNTICLNYSNALINTTVCDSDSNSKVYSYTINSSTNITYIGVFFDGVFYRNVTHTYGVFNPSISIDFEYDDASGDDFMDKVKSEQKYLITFYVIMLVLAALMGWMAEKYFEGYGVYGTGLFMAFLGVWGFWLFWVPATPIIYHFIIERFLPLFRNK